MRTLPRFGARQIWLWLLLALAVQAQQLGSAFPLNSNAAGISFSGRVLNAATGDPLQRVQVTLHAININPLVAYSAVSDAGGRFSFNQIPSGKYELSATKKGFLSPDYANRPPSMPSGNILELNPSAHTPLLIRLFPMSVIAGRVTDVEGEPVAEAAIEAKPVGASVKPAEEARAVTNDLGEYRLYGLIPGRYYVSATPGSGAATIARRVENPLGIDNCVRTFYPRSADTTSAQVVALRQGDQATDIDIELIKSAPHVIKAVNLAVDTPEAQQLTANHAAGAAASPAVEQANIRFVTGRVLDAVNDLPVRRAKVMLLNVDTGGAVPYVSESDSNGEFHVRNLEPGAYRLWALRDGFLPSGASTGALLHLQSGAEVRNVVVRMSPSSVITGTVFDDTGEPASDIRVEAIRVVYSHGKQEMRVQAAASTNDLGRYRLYCLPPGNYYVKTSANRSSKPKAAGVSSSLQYVASYYPRATDIANAALVNVRPGDQVGGIDVWTENRIAATIAGRIRSLDGGQVSRETVISVTPRDQSGDVAVHTADVKDAEGDFEVRNVLPGRYVVFSMLRRGNLEFAGSQPVEVRDGDVEDVQIAMSPAVNTTGAIRIAANNGSNLQAHLGALRVLLQPENGFPTGTVFANAHRDGTFALRNVLPERYTLKVFGVPDAFYISGVQAGESTVEGRVIDFSAGVAPVQISLRAEGGVLIGLAVGNQEQPVSGATLVLVPDGANATAEDLYKVSTSAKDGSFRIVGIAPGEYTFFAWEHVEADAYFDRDFLARYQDFGRRVVVRANSSETLNVSVIPLQQR